MVYFWVMISFSFAFLLIISFFGNPRETEYYVYVRFNKFFWPISISILTVLNFTLLFLKTKTYADLVCNISLNLFLFLYYFFDLFYNGQKTNLQIFDMQSKLIESEKLSDIFSINDCDISVDKSTKIVESQYAFIPKKPGNIIIISINDNDLKLTPLKEIDINDLIAYMEQINFHYFKRKYEENYFMKLEDVMLKVFRDSDLKKYNKTIIHKCNSKFYNFIESKKFLLTKKIIPYVLIGILLIFAVLTLINDRYNLGLFKWLYQYI